MTPSTVKSIFLSATATDCNEWRYEVKSALECSIEYAKVHLQEDWCDAAVFVVDACRSRVLEQDAFFGLFGHRYGWIPPGYAPDSITKLEWKWAIERWKNQREAPLFILLPKPNSEADIALKEVAIKLLKEEHPDDEAIQKKLIEQQHTFINEVREWSRDRFIISYTNKQNLREISISAIYAWNLTLYKKATSEHKNNHGLIPNDELGRIGRASQIDQLEALIEYWCSSHRTQIACIAVHGPQNHGQRVFCDLLANWEGWEEFGQVEKIDGYTDSPENYFHLALWICSRLNRPNNDLADPLHTLGNR